MSGQEVRFVAMQNFTAAVAGARNNYIEGLTYTARAGDADDFLRARIADWEEQGLIQIVSFPDARRYIRGRLISEN